VKAKKFIENVFSQREGGSLAPLETAEILNAAFAEAHGAGASHIATCSSFV
jgi:hypothetical protein